MEINCVFLNSVQVWCQRWRVGLQCDHRERWQDSHQFVDQWRHDPSPDNRASECSSLVLTVRVWQCSWQQFVCYLWSNEATQRTEYFNDNVAHLVAAVMPPAMAAMQQTPMTMTVPRTPYKFNQAMRNPPQQGPGGQAVPQGVSIDSILLLEILPCAGHQFRQFEFSVLPDNCFLSFIEYFKI